MKSKWWHISIISTVIAALALQSCGSNDNVNDTIVRTPYYTFDSDSLINNDAIVYSIDGVDILTNLKGNNGQELKLSYPHLNTTAGIVNTDHKLIDALSAMSASIVTNRGYMHFDTNSDLYDAIGLTLSYVNPDLSMQLLKEKVKNGVIEGNETDLYPAFNNRLAWPAAAWRVYQVNGDKEWLKYAYDVSIATFEQEQDITFYKRDWLARGCPSDYTPLVDMLPQWMEHSDVFSTFTLSNNAETAHSLAAIGEMAEELGEDGEKFAKMAQDLNIAVNEDMWNEKHGQYTALVYGQSCTMHAPFSDNRAQAIAVMWGLADQDKRGTTLIAKTPVTYYGVNNFYPARHDKAEPCLAEQSWGLTQGLWNMAAAHVGNDNALRQGLAALWRAQALYTTLFINDGSANLDITCAISNIAMTHRILAGMNFESNGIEFAPTVPACFTGDKHIQGFNYRGSTLDITIKGTGHDVEHIDMDDKRLSGNFIKAEQLKGNHHTIVVTMKEGHEENQGIEFSSRNETVPAEPIVTWNGDSAIINNYNNQYAYSLIIDGALTSGISDSIFALPQIDNFSEIAVVAINRKVFSFASRPFIIGGSKFKTYTIPGTDVNKDAINVNITVPEAGDYMLSVNYISPAAPSDTRTVSANTHRQGVVILGGLKSDSISGQSNLIHVDLLRNNNTITISTTPTMGRIATPITLNLFKK